MCVTFIRQIAICVASTFFYPIAHIHFKKILFTILLSWTSFEFKISPHHMYFSKTNIILSKIKLFWKIKCFNFMIRIIAIDQCFNIKNHNWNQIWISLKLKNCLAVIISAISSFDQWRLYSANQSTHNYRIHKPTNHRTRTWSWHGSKQLTK